MGEETESEGVEADDLRLLGYVRHMAATARTEAARLLFEEYVEQEAQRLRVTEARYGGVFQGMGLSHGKVVSR